MDQLSGHLWRPITAEWYCNDWRTGRKKRRENIENHTETLLTQRGSFLVATSVVFLFLLFYCISLCSLFLFCPGYFRRCPFCFLFPFFHFFYFIIALSCRTVLVCFALLQVLRRKLATGGQWSKKLLAGNGRGRPSENAFDRLVSMGFVAAA